jgi:hypothetical protein
MNEKVICKLCGKEFSSEDGLANHTRDKHPSGKKETESKNNRKIKKWVILILVVGVIFYGVFLLINGIMNESEECKTLPASELNIGGHTNLKLHTHQDLTIMIDGVKQIIPGNIGLGNNLMRPVHTHDGTGHIHTEAPCIRDLTLGDFFDIWNKPFNENQILDKTSETGTISLTVNGKLNTDFRNLILRDGQNIVIEYKSN